MSGVTLKVNIKERELKDLINGFLKRSKNMKPAFQVIGKIVRDSVRENFRAGGRPDKWPSLSKATLKRKKGSRILIETKRLMNSINYKAEKDRARIGTNVIYGAIHQFGIGRRSSLSSGRVMPAIPARPFLMVQDKDWKDITETLSDYLTKGAK